MSDGVEPSISGMVPSLWEVDGLFSGQKEQLESLPDTFYSLKFFVFHMIIMPNQELWSGMFYTPAIDLVSSQLCDEGGGLARLSEMV